MASSIDTDSLRSVVVGRMKSKKIIIKKPGLDGGMNVVSELAWGIAL